MRAPPVPERAKARAVAGGVFLLSAAARGFHRCRSDAGRVGFDDHYAGEARYGTDAATGEPNRGAAE